MGEFLQQLLQGLGPFLLAVGNDFHDLTPLLQLLSLHLFDNIFLIKTFCPLAQQFLEVAGLLVSAVLVELPADFRPYYWLLRSFTGAY